jgi:hypothetical protein
MTYRKTPEQGGSSADRATPSVEMGLNAGRDRNLPPTPLRKLGHDVQERRGGSTRRKFMLNGSKFRHDLVVHGDLNARAHIPLDPSDESRQPFPCFADREFHQTLQVNTLKMYNHVQGMSTRRRLRPSRACACLSMKESHHSRPDNPLNPANKDNPGVPFAPLDGGKGRRRD